jgi:predicted DNA-binding protein (MmcQ/YjbR family)
VHIDALRRHCLSFPRAKENLQWGDNLCFKVAGKIFAIVNLDSVPQTVCFKCSARVFEELLEQEDARPAPYLGRYKWIMLDRLDAVPADDLRDLIAESYALVSAKLPRRRKSKPPRK